MKKFKKIISKIRYRLPGISPTEKAKYLQKHSEITIGEGCEIYGKVAFGSEPYLIKLGNNVRIAAGVRFITHDGGMWVIRNMGLSPNADKVGTIEIGDNVMIGSDSIIMPGVKVGSNVVVGVGSIVTKNIMDNTVVAGIPAKKISTIEDYYNKNIYKIDQTKQMLYDEKKEYYKQKFNL